MSSEDADQEYGGRGLPEDYEPNEDELSSYQYALLELLQEAEFLYVGTDDDAPKRKDDPLAFVFDHPDHEGGLMVPIRLGDLTVTRATRTANGDWMMNEDVGVFDELPDWATHHPEEDEP